MYSHAYTCMYVCVCVQVNKVQTPTTADKAPFCSRTPAPEKASMQTGPPSDRTAAAADTVVCKCSYTRVEGAIHLPMCCTTAIYTALQMKETRVSGDKEGKAPSVPVSPIYSSPIKSRKVQSPSVNTTWIDTVHVSSSRHTYTYVRRCLVVKGRLTSTRVPLSHTLVHRTHSSQVSVPT